MNNLENVHYQDEPGCYDRYIASIVPRYYAMLSTLLDYLPSEPEHILELGCGTGMLTIRMRGAFPGAEITAIDLSPEMLEIAASKPELARVRFLAQDLRDPWPEEHWDAIVTSLCLHHIAPEERAVTAVRAAMALRPCGRFLCADIFRPESDLEEELILDIWRRCMERGRVPKEVMGKLLASRKRGMPSLSTIAQFCKLLSGSGFHRVYVPFVSGFAGVVVGFMES